MTWLEYIKGLVLWNRSHRTSMTQGNSRISERSFGEGPVMMVGQSPEALNQASDSLQGALAGGADWTLCDTLQLPVPLG